MNAVRDLLTDTPADSKDKLIELGFGLSYK